MMIVLAVERRIVGARPVLVVQEPGRRVVVDVDVDEGSRLDAERLIPVDLARWLLERERPVVDGRTDREQSGLVTGAAWRVDGLDVHGASSWLAGDHRPLGRRRAA